MAKCTGVLQLLRVSFVCVCQCTSLVAVDGSMLRPLFYLHEQLQYAALRSPSRLYAFFFFFQLRVRHIVQFYEVSWTSSFCVRYNLVQCCLCLLLE
jgi:hypothetical protein